MRNKSRPPHMLYCESDDDPTFARWRETYPDGKVRQECVFRRGVPDGAYRAFHPNGRPWIEGRYIDGKKRGLWVQFDPHGFKSAEGRYRDGHFIQGVHIATFAACESLAGDAKIRAP